MTDTEYELFSDPARIFVDGALQKKVEQEQLAKIFARQPEPEPDEIDEFAALVAERIVEKLSAATP